MKLIKKKSNNVVLMCIEDDAIIDFEQYPSLINEAFYFDVTEETHEVVENCGLPEDSLNDEDGNPIIFKADKFIYTDSWALNPDWIEPKAQIEEVAPE